MSFHKKCFKKSPKLKHNNTNTNTNTTINHHNHSLSVSNLHRNESITIEQNSLISLCSPFITPSNTKHHSYILKKDNFNYPNSNISLSVIYGDIDEPPNLASTNSNSNSSHYSHINKNNHLNSLLSTILLLDEIDNNKLYYTAINNDISIDDDINYSDNDINTDNILLSDDSFSNSTTISDSDSDSDSDSNSDSELDLESESHLNISSISIAAGSTILQDRVYEKTVLDIDNDFNTDFANILSEIDVQIAST